MKFKITSNKSGHQFSLGEVVKAGRPYCERESVDAWEDYQQVFMVNEDGESWWVGVDEFEVSIEQTER